VRTTASESNVAWDRHAIEYYSEASDSVVEEETDVEELCEVKYKKPNKWQYLGRILKCFLSIELYRHVAYLLSYIVLNFTRGRIIADVGKNTNLHPTVLLREAERIVIGNDCLINHGNVLQAGRKEAYIRIGNHVQTGPNVMMFAYNHSFDDPRIPIKKQDYYDGDIVINDDVWIGAGSIILAGVTIGKGAVIAAGSVVNKDIPPFTVCAGVPAEIIRNRII